MGDKQVTELPVRTSKFVVRKQWIVCGADDMFIRVYNYNTSEQVKVFEAHTDYIRCIAVHPSLPCVPRSPSGAAAVQPTAVQGWRFCLVLTHTRSGSLSCSRRMGTGNHAG